MNKMKKTKEHLSDDEAEEEVTEDQIVQNPSNEQSEPDFLEGMTVSELHERKLNFDRMHF